MSPHPAIRILVVSALLGLVSAALVAFGVTTNVSAKGLERALGLGRPSSSSDSSKVFSDLPESDRGSPFGSFGPSEVPDPIAGKVFLISFDVLFESLPPIGKRQNILSKYRSKVKPYSGWAVAVRSTPASLRPSVYWRGGDGTGGWHDFGDMALELNEWYSFTLVARASDYIGFYVQKVSSGKGSRAKGSGGKVSRQSVSFLGGHSIDGLETPKTEAELNFGRRRRGDYKLRSLLISNSSLLPEGIEEILPVLEGGPRSVKQLLEESSDTVQLWLPEPIEK